MTSRPEPVVDSLLRRFRNAFEGQRYIHRIATTGDKVAQFLYEDLLALGRSAKLTTRAQSGQVVVNVLNRVTGRVGRRGDGTLGERVPTAIPTAIPDYAVQRGPVANVEIGTEVKICATKMIAQIDRVMGDLEKQAVVFRKLNPRAICVGVVGVNHADSYTGYEAKRVYPARVPPGREAAEIVRRLDQNVRPHYDELLILRFRATNSPPYPFSWVNELETQGLYSSVLVRISSEYETRF